MRREFAPARRGDIVLLVVGLGIEVALSFHIRLRAWPETLVPAYLVSRGWTLYREIKFIHGPLWIGFEALISTLFGLTSVSLRALALLPATACYGALWFAAREFGWRAPARWGASLFFLTTFYLWDGNAIYPDVAIAALAVPAFLGLKSKTPRGVSAAGFLLGCAVAIKQPAMIALLLAAIWVSASCKPHLARFAGFAALPLAACAAVFAAIGAGRDFLLWTIVVPIRDCRTRLPINTAQVPTVILGALVFAVFLAVMAENRSRRAEAGTALLCLLTAGLATMALPRFELVHLIPAVPLLALAAGFGIEGALRLGSVRRWIVAIPAVVIAIEALFLGTDTSTGEISFWNSPTDDAIVRQLSSIPEAPLYLYGPDQDLFIRSARVPPGRLYVNPTLWYFFRAEDLERRQIEILRAHPETILVSSGGVPTGDVGTTLGAWVSARSAAMPARAPVP